MECVCEFESAHIKVRITTKERKNGWDEWMKRKPKVRILHSGRYAFGCHKSFSKASTQYVKLVKHCYSATTTTINGTAKKREREGGGKNKC